MLATKQIKDMMAKPANKGYSYDHMLSKHIAWGEAQDDVQYNRISRTGMGVYMSLTNCLKMVEAANDVHKESYQGLALFIKAYRLFDLSLSLGDIPYSEAMKGEEGVAKPKYDTQKDVMKHILDDLDAAYRHFSTATRKFDGDVVYGGDPEKWKIATSVFQLKVLLNLSRKESDAELNIKQRFAKILAERQLMTSNADNFQLVFANTASQKYPTHTSINNFHSYPEMTVMLIDSLKRHGDYRMFHYAQPARAKTEADIAASEWDAYLGVDPSRPFDELGTLFTTGSISNMNARYYELEACQPLIRIGYAEQNFILAEACLRGWISGNASQYYLRGIEASMKFTASNTPDNAKYHHDRKMTDDYIQGFLATPAIQLTSGAAAFESNLNKIIMQKYIDKFMHYTYDCYYEYRRTGYPRLPVNPATNLNTKPDRMPVRWMYEQREYDYNRENVEEAVKRQFNGNDDVNELMWILK
jgi:hypothetical protein